MPRDLIDVLNDFNKLHDTLVMLDGDVPFDPDLAGRLMERHRRLRVELKDAFWAARRKGIDLTGVKLPYSVW